MSGGPSGDVRPGLREIGRPRLPASGPGDRRDAVLVAEAADPDRDPVGLPADGVTERVADRRLDLSGDLGDGQPVRDGELEVDRQLVADLEAEARLGDAETLEEAARRPATRKARDAVDRQRGGAH